MANGTALCEGGVVGKHQTVTKSLLTDWNEDSRFPHYTTDNCMFKR